MTKQSKPADSKFAPSLSRPSTWICASLLIALGVPATVRAASPVAVPTAQRPNIHSVVDRVKIVRELLAKRGLPNTGDQRPFLTLTQWYNGD